MLDGAVGEMISSASYSGVSLAEWEQAARRACFKADQQVKSQAERFFFQFVQAPDLTLLLELLRAASGTLLFVLFTYLYKHPRLFGRNIEHFKLLLQSIASWKLQDGCLVREKGVLKDYETRTIMYSLGVFLMSLYENSDTKKQVLPTLRGFKDSYFKLCLLRSLVEAVEAFDYSASFPQYRGFVLTFQTEIMPYVVETLMPYFYAVEEKLQINELSSLQQRLSVDNYLGVEERVTSQEQEEQASYIMLLLKRVVLFPYFISFAEYELDDTVEIPQNFPIDISKRIMNAEFVKAFFFLILHLRGSRRNEFVLIGLDCLAKMLAVKISTVEATVRGELVCAVMKGLNELACICRQAQQLLQSYVHCNKKLLNGCEIAYLKQAAEQHELYQAFITNITSAVLQVLQQPICFENHLQMEALELAYRALLSYGYYDEESLEQDSLFFMEFAKSTMDTLLNSLACSSPLFSSSSILFGESDLKVKQLFYHFKKIASYNYLYFYSRLSERLDQCTSKHFSLTSFANILLLLAEAVDLASSSCERSSFFNSPNEHEIAILAGAAKKASNVFLGYMDSHRLICHKEASYLQFAILHFTGSITLECLSSITCSQKFRIKNKLCLQMAGEGEAEEAVLVYVRVLLGFLEGSHSLEEERKLLYVIEIMEKIIKKMKWDTKREMSTNTCIFKTILHNFSRLMQQSSTILAVQNKIAKVVAILTFEGIEDDDYKRSIDSFIAVAKQKSIPFLIYDLIGAFEAISTHEIAKHFCRKLNSQIDIARVFESGLRYGCGQRSETVLKDACKLVKIVVNNNGLNQKNNAIVYQYLGSFMPSLTQFLQAFQGAKRKDIDFWIEAVVQVVDMMTVVMGGTHANLFLVELANRQSNLNPVGQSLSEVKLFLVQMLKSVNILLQNDVRVYPGCKQAVSKFCLELNTHLLMFLFKKRSDKILTAYSDMHFQVIQLVITQIGQHANSNKMISSTLLRFVDALKSFFSFACINSSRKHLEDQFKGLQFIFNVSAKHKGCDQHQVLLFYLLSYVFTNRSCQPKQLKIVFAVIYWITRISKDYFIGCLSTLNILDAGTKAKLLAITQDSTDSQQFVTNFKNFLVHFDNDQ